MPEAQEADINTGSCLLHTANFSTPTSVADFASLMADRYNTSSISVHQSSDGRQRRQLSARSSVSAHRGGGYSGLGRRRGSGGGLRFGKDVDPAWFSRRLVRSGRAPYDERCFARRLINSSHWSTVVQVDDVLYRWSRSTCV